MDYIIRMKIGKVADFNKKKVWGRSGLTLPIVWGSISLSKVSLWYYRDGSKKRICDQHKADL